RALAHGLQALEHLDGGGAVIGGLGGIRIGHISLSDLPRLAEAATHQTAAGLSGARGAGLAGPRAPSLAGRHKALRGWGQILIGMTTYLNCSSSGSVISAEALASGMTDQVTSSVLTLD